MKCPKCKHHWVNRRKRKISIPIQMSGPGEVFPQQCWKCERTMGPGERVFAAVDRPAAFCATCVDGRRELNAVVVDVVAPAIAAAA